MKEKIAKQLKELNKIIDTLQSDARDIAKALELPSTKAIEQAKLTSDNLLDVDSDLRRISTKLQCIQHLEG